MSYVAERHSFDAVPFQWPGYEVLDFNESVSVAGRNDGDIAIDIAQVLQKFMKVIIAVTWWNRSSPMHTERT